MVIKVAILDDEQKDLNKVHNYFKSISSNNIQYNCDEYHHINESFFNYDLYVLDIELPSSGTIDSERGETNGTYKDKWGSCWLNSDYGACRINMGEDGALYFLNWDLENSNSNKRSCWANPKDSVRANKLCQAMTGKTGRDHPSNPYRIYNFY